MTTAITQRMTYAWKAGARVNANSQEAGDTLEAIRRAEGGITPVRVVEEARSALSPLHTAFEWDDTRAAEEHRLLQARHLIGGLVVVREQSTEGSQSMVRAFVVVQENDEQHYTSISVALADPEMRRQVLTRALRELEAWQKRYEELEELGDLFTTAKKVRTQIQEVA